MSQEAAVPQKIIVRKELAEEKSGCSLCKWMEDNFAPWRKGSKSDDVPVWLTALCLLSFFGMLNQIKIPAGAVALPLPDLCFIVGFVPCFLYLLVKRRGIFYPFLGLIALLCAGVSNLLACSGKEGAVEVVQLVQTLLCGTVLLSFLVENAPGLTAFALFAAIALNGGVAIYQAKVYGFGSVLPPADVLKVSWGFGGAYTGLFRSRMAFSFFMASGLAWLLPVFYGRRRGIFNAVAAFLLTVFCLLAIAHGQMFFVVCLVIIPGAFLISRRAGISTLLAVLCSLCIIAHLLPEGHGDTVLGTLNPLKTGEYSGELKTNHLDFAAALKMAARKPFTGVGSGRYQQCVGRCYGDLPNPSYNDIDTDTQSGWGILAGTLGFPCAALILVLFLSSGAAGVRRYLKSSSVNTLALGGGMALCVAVPGMFVSDPFIRGLAWLPVLGLASCCVPNRDEAISPLWRIAPATAVVCGIALGLLAAAVWVREKSQDPLFRNAVTVKPVETEVDGSGEAVAKSDDVFIIIDAADAVSFTPPFEKGGNSLAAKQSVLTIPDGKGTPPEDKEPAMEYGGAQFEFELSGDAKCRVWLRVWWDGSCGNTLNLRMDEDAKSVTVGNDGTYRSWHWLEAPRLYDLKEGRHTLQLLNREDGIMFDQMLLTSDMEYVPQDIEE